MAFGLGSTLGEVLVKVGIDTSSMQTGLAKAKGEVDSAGTSVSKFGTYAKVAFGIAAVAAVKFGAEAVASAREHEEVLAQLKAAVKGSTGALEGQATALQNVTGFQDEEIIKAQTVLARFKLTETQLRDLIPVTLDYARATGKDAATAADAIGKALLGNTRALKSIGIQYTSTGDSAEDFTNIVELLTEKVGGSAARYAETYSGKLDILAARFDDLKESVGYKLLGPLEDIVSLFTSGADQVASLTNALDTGAITWHDYQGAVKDAMDTFPDWAKLQIAEQYENVADAEVSMQRAAMGASYQQENLADATELAAAAAREQNTALRATVSALPGLIGAILNLRNAQRDLRQAQHDGSTTAAELKQKELAVVEAFLGVKSALGDVIEKFRDGNATAKDVMDRFRDLAHRAGLTRGQIADLASIVRGYINDLADIPREVVTTVRTNYTNQQLASGTRNFAGGVALVGERGPELVGLPRGSTVFDAVRTRALQRDGTVNQLVGRGAGGGQTVVVHVAGSVIAERDLMRLVRQAANQGAARNALSTGF